MDKEELNYEDRIIIEEIENALDVKIDNYKDFMGENIFYVSDNETANKIAGYITNIYKLETEIVNTGNQYKIFCSCSEMME